MQFDAYDTHQAWCKGLDRFLDKIAVNKVFHNQTTHKDITIESDIEEIGRILLT